MSPDLVTVLYGSNDGWRAQAPDSDPIVSDPLTGIVGSSRVLSLAQRKLNGLARSLGVPRPQPAPRVRVPRVPPEQFEANLVKIAKLIGDAGAIPVFLTAPAAFATDRPPEAYFLNPWMVPRPALESTRARYADAARQAAASASVLLVDCARLMPPDPALFLDDGYHPNRAGYQMMAERVVAVMRKAGVIPGAEVTPR